MKIDGKKIASDILSSLNLEIKDLKSKNITPTLGIILIGNDNASESYIKQKKIRADEIGAKTELFKFSDLSEEKLIQVITKLNADKNIHGIIVQRPLPIDIDRDKIAELINPDKDVDGFNSKSEFNAPVALAVWEILNSLPAIELKSKKIAVVGKGETAGKPIIKLLNKEGISPVVIGHQTEHPNTLIKTSDIVITAVGKSGVIKPEYLNKKQVLIGVGLHMDENGKLKGDFNDSEIENKVAYYSPTLGGVGPVNVSFLMKNLVTSTVNQL